MNTEFENTTNNLTNIWTPNVQNFTHLVNIDDLLSGWDMSQTTNQSTSNIYTPGSNTSNWMSKLKIIWAGAGILLLTVVSGTFVYMMYPIEFQNFSKNIQWNVLNNTQTWWYTNPSNNNINNKNNLTEPSLDSWSKNQIDNLFAWKWLSWDEPNIYIWNTKSDNTDNINNNSEDTKPKIEIDNPSKLNQNPDWSSWLTADSNLLEWLNGWSNYGNGDEESKIKLLWQIRAKIEIAKINYTDAKKSQNIQSMKLIAWSLSKYKKLLTQVENNEITITSEIQDKIVEIQSDIDKAKILIQ